MKDEEINSAIASLQEHVVYLLVSNQKEQARKVARIIELLIKIQNDEKPE